MADESRTRTPSTLLFSEKKAGTFFNPVPENSDANNSDNNDDVDNNKDDTVDDEIEDMKLLNREKTPTPPSSRVIPIQSLSSDSKTIPISKTESIKVSGIGFGALSQPPAARYKPPAKNQKPFVGIGPPLNDITKPEYDEQGYTLYADERTGEKSRVFEALVEYPCMFTMKIVGDGTCGNFVNDMLYIVAQSCEVDCSSTPSVSITETIQHSVRTNGKWTSLTVQAPVKSATMLYQLYENVDRDPRVKFKF